MSDADIKISLPYQVRPIMAYLQSGDSYNYYSLLKIEIVFHEIVQWSTSDIISGNQKKKNKEFIDLGYPSWLERNVV